MSKNIFYIGIAIVGVALAVFAWWAISPLFNNIVADEALPTGQMAPEERMEEPMPEAEGTPTTPTSSELVVLGEGTIVDTPAHPASGRVRVLEVDGKAYVRYEDFKTINGPDIFVYLAKDLEASDFVNLGRVKATEGNVNYEVPAGVDPREYPYVLVWCKAFGVLFNSAKVQ